MSQTPLAIGSLIRSGAFYDQVYTFEHDLPFYKKWAAQAKGKILELCCGTGRVTLPIAEAGGNVTGVDFTESMLNEAKRKAAAKGRMIRFELADVRSLSLKEKYSLFMIPFNSLEDFYELADLEKVFQTVRRHAEPDARLVFDVNHPQLENLLVGKRTVPLNYKFNIGTSGVEISERMQYDSARQCNRVVRTYSIDGHKTEVPLDLRVYFSLELDSILRYNGFEILQKYGDFEGSPFVSESLKQVFVCRVGRK